jgi:hypothetical protein
MADVGASVGKAHPMLTVVPKPAGSDRRLTDNSTSSSLIDEIVREGARRMLAEALKAEVDAYIAQFTDERDENGRRLVVRNGSHQAREILGRRTDVVGISPERGPIVRLVGAVLAEQTDE